MNVREKTERLISFEDVYTAHRFLPDTWMIKTKTEDMPFSCDCYLLEGDDWALAIDSGMQLPNIAEYMALLTDKPILGVINTHSHFDHTGGNSCFNKVFMSPLAEEGAKTPFGDAERYDTDYEITPVTQGSKIDLGNRELEIIEIGAHDLSSIAILDRGRKVIFTGDELESGWCNVGSMRKMPGSTIERHYGNMLKIKKLFEEGAFEMICPAHHGAPMSGESVLDYVKCDEMILDGVEGCLDVPKKCLPFGMAPKEAHVMIYKSAHICYRTDAIRE